ncbi:MAG: uncharacterized protein KVP18_004783, partial [Porospora cf. gigantea A]|uniref:uncharacterized protein n=1 Tax=Porospora cf. gigantea A TaxID=2853593 RepID=UPI0035594FBE
MSSTMITQVQVRRELGNLYFYVTVFYECGVNNAATVTITVGELRRLLSLPVVPESQTCGQTDTPPHGEPGQKPAPIYGGAETRPGTTPDAGPAPGATTAASQGSGRIPPTRTPAVATTSLGPHPISASQAEPTLAGALHLERSSPSRGIPPGGAERHYGPQPEPPQRGLSNSSFPKDCGRNSSSSASGQGERWNRPEPAPGSQGRLTTSPPVPRVRAHPEPQTGGSRGVSEGTLPLSGGLEGPLPTASNALAWVADDPHAYDWALLEGTFSAYESPPPLGVFVAYPSPRLDELAMNSRAFEACRRTSTRDLQGPVPGAAEEPRGDQRQERYLSEEEKVLSLAQLHRKWKEEAQKRANLRKESRPSDWDDLGHLEPEMLQWTKAAIRRVIWSRKQDRWLRRMRELNIPVHTCEVCSRQVTSNHRCVPTGLAVPAPGDTPYSRKELIVSQQGKNLSLKPKVVVNSDKLREELEKMTSILAQKEELAYQQEQFAEALLGLADALVTDPSYGTPRYGSASQATAADRSQGTENAPSRDGSFSPEQESLPLTTACRLPEEAPSRRRRSSTSFPLQFLRLTQGSQDYHGLVDTGSQINLIDANLAATLVRDDA